MPGFSLISAVAGPYFPDHAPESVSLPSLKHLERGRAAEVRSRAFPPCSQFFRLNHFTKSLKQAPEFINAHTIETSRLWKNRDIQPGPDRRAGNQGLAKFGRDEARLLKQATCKLSHAVSSRCLSLCKLFGIEFCALFGITRPAKFERTARVARAIGVVAVGQDCS
jgi:hypothetical protein